MGSVCSSKTLTVFDYINAGDEMGAVKFIENMSRQQKYLKESENLEVFRLAYGKKQSHVVIELLRYRNYSIPEYIPYCNDAEIMTEMGKRTPQECIPNVLLFASREMFEVFVKNCRHNMVYYMFSGINDRNIINAHLQWIEAIDLDEWLTYLDSEYGDPWMKSQITSVVRQMEQKRNNENTKKLIQLIETRMFVGAGIIIKTGKVNFRMIHDGESLLMLSLRFGSPWLAHELIPKVDLAHECKGRNAMHYALPYPNVVEMILKSRAPKWDMKFVTTDLTIMRKFIDHYQFRRADCIEIFEIMTRLNIVDEDLRTFYDMIQKSVSTSDIPDLMKLLMKFPLTRDRLAEIIKPTNMEAELAALRTLLQASAAVPAVVLASPPAYNPDH